MNFFKAIILVSIISFFPLKSQSVYIEKLLGSAQPEYIAEYFSRMWNWYNKEFFNFNQSLSKNELEFIKLWKSDLKSWGVKIDNNFYRENFIFSHKVKGKKRNSSLFYIGSQSWGSEQINLLKLILSEKNIKLPDDYLLNKFLGIRWNVEEKIIGLYFRETEERRLKFINFKKEAFLSKGIIEKATKYNFSLGPMNNDNVTAVMKITTEGEGERYHFRFNGFFTFLLSEPGQVVNIKHFREFRQLFGSAEVVDQNEFVVHYP